MAELRVLSVREIELTGRAAQQWGPRGYESEILLITGRTHQVSTAAGLCLSRCSVSV